MDYDVKFQICNTRQFGIPHSRPRVYVLAVTKESLAKPLGLPEARQTHPRLHTFLDKESRGTERLQLPHYESKLGDRMWKEGFVLDVGSSVHFQRVTWDAAPCLTRTRCKQHGYYIPKLLRCLSCLEMGRLQGLPSPVIKGLMTTCRVKELPKGSFEEAVGDAMSINVLQTSLRMLLGCAGLPTGKTEAKDFWRLCPDDKCHQLSDALWLKYQ